MYNNRKKGAGVSVVASLVIDLSSVDEHGLGEL